MLFAQNKAHTIRLRKLFVYALPNVIKMFRGAKTALFETT